MWITFFAYLHQMYISPYALFYSKKYKTQINILQKTCKNKATNYCGKHVCNSLKIEPILLVKTLCFLYFRHDPNLKDFYRV